MLAAVSLSILRTDPFLPSSLRTGALQQAQQILPIAIINEDVLTPITAAHHVINRTAVFKAQGGEASRFLAKTLSRVNSLRCEALTPFALPVT